MVTPDSQVAPDPQSEVLAFADAETSLETLEGATTGRVLIVDDTSLIRRFLREYIVGLGHEVLEAEDGEVALRVVETGNVDVVLLDLEMPKMHGIDVLRRLKADPKTAHLPVIVCSSSEDMDRIIECIELGAEDYLPKPADPVLLRARLKSSIERKRLRDQAHAHLREMQLEKLRVEELLHVIFPHSVVEELRATSRVSPRQFDDVAVLFADIVGFTTWCDGREPDDVVTHLQDVIEAFEDIALAHGLDKTKTIGDAFMATAGLLTPVHSPVLNAVRCGLDFVATMDDLDVPWTVRVGIHVGPVTAGVVGRRQYLYDLWGDTVNTAARVESNGLPAAVVVSKTAWERIADVCDGQSLGNVALKGKGDLELFRVQAVNA